MKLEARHIEVVQLTRRYQFQIIQAYAPASSHTDEEIEEFYEEIEQLHTKGKQHIKLIMGNFNARIGQQEQGETSVGKYGHGERKVGGDKLIEFAKAGNRSVMNSFFKKKLKRKWAWKHPNGGTSEIDYILARNQLLKIAAY